MTIDYNSYATLDGFHNSCETQTETDIELFCSQTLDFSGIETDDDSDSVFDSHHYSYYGDLLTDLCNLPSLSDNSTSTTYTASSDRNYVKCTETNKDLRTFVVFWCTNV